MDGAMKITIRIGFFFSSRRRHTRLQGDWSSDVCSSDLAQPLLAAGPDGLYGTADDDTARPDVVIMSAGPDNILGTSDDVVMSLKNMTRTIAIADVPAESGLRQITITINYTVGALTRQYTLVSFIAQFS